ncbi:hypothetical protein RCH18_002955 [Flavobacterium sp. PL11]|uniref:hypothetical protein n=1 Tax=Flavobacterium sp. PL11 TaxID=3071717 RepID=UPI002E04D24D|nr:hypothetical protein [Flavobacterium sp. PL11]
MRFHKNDKDLQYIKLIGTEIEEFRMLFLDWISSFDTNNNLIWDEWGLFNQPGAIKPNILDNYKEDDFNIDDFLNDFSEDED